jgi:heme/copper-type cytochrome/quinol oxidase subunit 2
VDPVTADAVMMLYALIGVLVVSAVVATVVLSLRRRRGRDDERPAGHRGHGRAP